MQECKKANQKTQVVLRHNIASHTLQKKWGYPSICKTARIAPKSVGIGSKCLSQCFFPGASNCRAVTVGIGSPDLYQRFSKALRQVQELFRPCSSVFTCVGQPLPIALKTCTSDFRAYIDAFFFLIIKKHWYRFIYTVL